MRNATSSDDIRSLAAFFRQMADATTIPEYSQLMCRAALELEVRATELESPKRSNSLLPDAKPTPLTRSFGAAAMLLSA